jgi:hypothetical protein
VLLPLIERKFLATELATLDAAGGRPSRGPPRTDRAPDCRKLAIALSVHAQGVVHRDLAVERHADAVRRVKLLDFGS